MTSCSQISFERRLSDRKYPSASERLVTSVQNSLSVSLDGIVSARTAERPKPRRTSAQTVSEANSERRLTIGLPASGILRGSSGRGAVFERRQGALDGAPLPFEPARQHEPFAEAIRR